MGRNPQRHLALSPNLRRVLSVGAASALILALPATCAANMYRWVDEHGRKHYGDSIPPRYVGNGYELLDNQGHVIKRVESQAQSAAKQRRQDAEAAREAAERQSELDKQRHDSALLSTYSNVGEIDRARDRALADESTQIEALKTQLQFTRDRGDAEKLNAGIAQHTQAMRDIRVRFEADKARYLELTSGN